MVEQNRIKYPVALKDWHMYVPQHVPYQTATAGSIPKQKLVCWQNQLYKLMLMWEEQIKTQYTCSFTIKEFQFQRMQFHDFPRTEAPSIIIKLSTPSFSFEVYLDERLAALLLGNAFGTTNSSGTTRLMHSELESIFFLQMFTETLSPILNQMNIDLTSMEKTIEYADKESNNLISEPDDYRIFTFYTLVPSIKEPCKISFAFTSANQDYFFEHLSLPRGMFPKIVVPAEAQKNIMTGVSARIGDVMLTFSDLRTLQSGDVLLLQKKVGDAVEVTIGEELKFTATFGIHGTKLSVQLLKHLSCDEHTVESSTIEESSNDLFSDRDSSDAEEKELTSILADNQEEKDDTDDEFDWEKL